MRTSVSGTSASVTINSSATAGQARTYTFGVQLASGEKLDASICCVVSLKPDEANLYTSTGQKLGGTFIPLANTIRSYDSTKNVPTGSQTVDLYLLDGTKITYKANGKISLYDMSFNGTSYFYGNPSGIPGWAKY
jgi:hypothetical protein